MSRHEQVHPTTAIATLFNLQEQQAILKLADELNLSPQAVLRQALRTYQLAQSDVKLPPKMYDDSDLVMAGLSILAEDGYATDSQRATARAAMAEIERLREGEFSDTEFQNLCHCMPENDRDAFFTGCTEYQRKLFGKAERDLWASAVFELFSLMTQDARDQWCFNSLSRDEAKFQAAMDKLHGMTRIN